jgi:hypothetical protein
MREFFSLESIHHSSIDEVFHQLNLGNIGNVIYWWKFFELTKDISGDIVECGIGRGRSMLVISAINALLEKHEGGQRQIYGYDSFEGFPEPTMEDDSYRKPKKGEWAHSPSGKYQYNQTFIQQVLHSGNIPNVENTILTKGFFSDSLKSHPDHPIAILHVDGDLYESYLDTLGNLYPKVSKGGVIVFDDFLAKKSDDDRWPGARKAVEEFFGDELHELKTSVRVTPYFIKK